MPISGAAIKALARRLIFSNSPRLFFVTIIFVLLTTTISLVSINLPGTVRGADIVARLVDGAAISFAILFTNFRPYGVFFGILLLLIQPIINFGYRNYCLKITNKRKTTFKDLLVGIVLFTKVMTIFFVTTAIILLWSILLIIPGIVVSYKYRLAYYILLDDPKKSALQCIKESTIIMHGVKLDLFTIDVSFIGWYFLYITLILPFPFNIIVLLLALWLTPYYGLTQTLFYTERINSITN
ncbi:MAG: DUF975 family protein [Oscillospiraceae bacterium]|jgi:hypothetical protein|nr:DUF975 family protein [Oscillospiraceae bacterium]